MGTYVGTWCVIHSTYDNCRDNYLSPVLINDRDIYAGLEFAYEYYRDLTWIESSRKLRAQGFWKTSSWIENHRELYAQGLRNTFQEDYASS